MSNLTEYVLDVPYTEVSPHINAAIIINGCGRDRELAHSKSSRSSSLRNAEDLFSNIVVCVLVLGTITALAVAGYAGLTLVTQSLAQMEADRQAEAARQLHNVQVHIDNPGDTAISTLTTVQEEVCK